jgi:hypothetical protein
MFIYLVDVVTRVKCNYHVLAWFRFLFFYLVDVVTRAKCNYLVLEYFHLLFIYLVDEVSCDKYYYNVYLPLVYCLLIWLAKKLVKNVLIPL